MDLLTLQNKRLLNDAVANARIKKMQEKQALESDKIGNATFIVGQKLEKGSPRANRDTLFIFTDNLQASNEVFGEQIGDTIEVEEGVKLNVKSTSALVRTDSNGDINPNAVGIVTKKNAQNKDGIFINKEGYFQDTDEDFDAFVAANQRAINRIKELIFGEGSTYTKISMVKGLATEKAALPERFVDKLADMLEKELGIFTQKIPNGKLFGLEVMPLGKKKEEKSKKDAALEEAKKRADDILASYLAERPKLDSIQVDPNDRSLLSKVYPNIEQRMARVSFISEAFSRYLTSYVDALRKKYENIPDRNEDEQACYEGLTKGKVSAQRAFALGHFDAEGEPVDITGGEPLGSSILGKIRADLINIARIGSSEEGIDSIAKQLLEGVGTLGQDFQEELAYRELENNPDKAYRFAFSRARYLSQEYATMADQKVFEALCRDAAVELEFLENIRLNFQKKPVKTEEEEDENENLNEEEKENANREGYMIKYKLMDPAKTLSIEIKTLLGSIYKRNYKDASQYVYNDLGSRVRMDALVAYRILLEEFSDMKSPNAFNSTLDRAIEKYPWLNDIRDILIYNPENPDKFNEGIRNEFFTTMRKAQVPYGMVTERGLLKRLNRNTSTEDFLANVRGNYEGHVVLGEHSIYNESGEINVDNCIAIHKLFSAAYVKDEDRIIGNTAEARKKRYYASRKYQPLKWANDRLRAFNNPKYGGKVADVIDALNILAGLSEEHPNLSLEKTLRNLGVDTSKLDIDSLFGEIPYMNEDELADIETLDDLQEYISQDQVNRITRILTAIETIVNQTGNKRLQPGDHLLTKFQGAYMMLGNALSLASEGYTAMTFRHAGAMRASYAAPDFISDLVGIVQNVNNIDEATAWLEKEYGQYDFFKDPVTGEWLNTWLASFFNEGQDKDYPFRKQFEYVNVLSFMGSSEDNLVGNIEKADLLTGIIHAFFAGNKDKYNNSYGWYRSPLISDVDACVLMKGVRYTGEGYKDKIAEGLVKVILQEVNRINSIRSPKPGGKKVDIEYYNSDKNNGTQFQYFPQLNTRLDEILEICSVRPDESPIEFVRRRNAELAEIATELVESKLTRFLEQFDDRAKLAMYRRMAANEAQQGKKEENNKPILEALDLNKEESKNERDRKIARIEELLTEFYWNDFFAQSQIQQLLGGDLAFYKNYTDYVKRNKQAYACGDRLFARETNEKGEIIGDLVETAMYLEDEDVITNTYTQLKELLLDSDLNDADKRIMEFALKSFEKICSTDGQSLRAMDSFKKIFKAKGVWTEDMETAYQNIEQGKITARDFLALWNPIKPFYFGHESIKTGGRNEKVVTQHKNSEYMITALYSWLNTALNNSPKLRGLHQFMKNHNIDVVHFHSVVKEGYNSPFNLNYNKKKFDEMSKKGTITLFGKPFKDTYKKYMGDALEALKNGDITQEEFNEIKGKFDYTKAEEVTEALEAQSKNVDGTTNELMFKKFPMDNYMIVQPSADHLIDDEAIFGSQLKNIIMADLPADFSIEVNLNGRKQKLNREEAVRFYNSLLVDNLLDAFSAVNREFSSIEKLQGALFEKMAQNPQYGDDVKAALQINDSHTGFMLPFNSPTLSNKIEALMLSTFKNEIQRQKIKGGNAVLVSNFGLHEDLKVKYVNDDPKQGVAYIEAYLPAANSDMYKDFLVNKGDYQEIDFAKMQDALDSTDATELLDIIGYRIPTEDKYSIMPIRIKGFMPVTAGTTIMLPADIVNMSGTDFDKHQC